MNPDKPPVLSRIADRAALVAFVEEAARRGYDAVFVSFSVANMMGAPTRASIPVMAERFIPEGCALAMPPMEFGFPREVPRG